MRRTDEDELRTPGAPSSYKVPKSFGDRERIPAPAAGKGTARRWWKNARQASSRSRSRSPSSRCRSRATPRSAACTVGVALRSPRMTTSSSPSARPRPAPTLCLPTEPHVAHRARDRRVSVRPRITSRSLPAERARLAATCAAGAQQQHDGPEIEGCGATATLDAPNVSTRPVRGTNCRCGRVCSTAW